MIKPAPLKNLIHCYHESDIQESIQVTQENIHEVCQYMKPKLSGEIWVEKNVLIWWNVDPFHDIKERAKIGDFVVYNACKHHMLAFTEKEFEEGYIEVKP